MKFKEGQKVKIRKDLKDADKIRGPGWCRDMDEFQGNTVIIMRVMHGSCYAIDKDDGEYQWLEEWLTPIQRKTSVTIQDML